LRESIAAKQDAFEEANRLKNQFRRLDEDEFECLDSVLESTRKEEERVKRETREGLEAFRMQQEEADKKAREGGDVQGDVDERLGDEEQWVAGGRKRKRKVEKEVLKGVKLRRASSAAEDKKVKREAEVETSTSPAQKVTEESAVKEEPTAKEELKSPASKPSPIPKPVATPAKSGLVDYGSEEDDDW